MYSLDILMKNFLKENKLSEIWAVMMNYKLCPITLLYISKGESGKGLGVSM